MIKSPVPALAKRLEQTNKKLPEIDVLRGLASLGVAWYHSRVDLWVGFKAIQADPELYSTFDRGLSFLSLPVSQMGSMVILFFVLSGFCIHLPVAKKGSPPNWSAYAVRRLLRIYPAYLITLLLCFLLAQILFNSANSEFAENNLYVASALMVQNWFLGGNQVAMNPSLWTIPIELEFYLAYPLLLWMYRKWGFPAVASFSLLCTVIGVGLSYYGSSQATGTFFKYAIIWNSGAWLAEAYSKGQLPIYKKWYSLAMVGIAVFTTIIGLAGVNGFYLDYGWALCSFLLLLWALGPGKTFFSASHWLISLLMFTGTVSYSLYLIHFPLFKIASFAWIHLYGSKPQSFFLPTLATLLAIPVAWLFYRLIELPSHNLARKLAASIQIENKAWQS